MVSAFRKRNTLFGVWPGRVTRRTDRGQAFVGHAVHVLALSIDRDAQGGFAAVDRATFLRVGVLQNLCYGGSRCVVGE